MKKTIKSVVMVLVLFCGLNLVGCQNTQTEEDILEDINDRYNDAYINDWIKREKESIEQDIELDINGNPKNIESNIPEDDPENDILSNNNVYVDDYNDESDSSLIDKYDL